MSDYKCFVCNKEIETLWTGEPGQEFNDLNLDGAISGRMHAAYGSKHDGSIYNVVICDECVEKKLKEVDNYLFPMENSDEDSK